MREVNMTLNMQLSESKMLLEKIPKKLLKVHSMIVSLIVCTWIMWFMLN